VSRREMWTRTSRAVAAPRKKARIGVNGSGTLKGNLKCGFWWRMVDFGIGELSRWWKKEER
jgi:hypothetical protein